MIGRLNYYLALMVLIPAFNAGAQDSGNRPKSSDYLPLSTDSWSLFVPGLGYQNSTQAQLQNVNRYLKTGSYPTAPYQFATFNFDFFNGIFKNYYVHFGYKSLLQSTTFTENARTAISAEGLDLKFGKVLFHSKKIIIIPAIGYAWEALFIVADQDGFQTTNEVQGEYYINSFDISLNVNYVFRGIAENDLDSKIGPCFSLEIGYGFSPFGTAWWDTSPSIGPYTLHGITYTSTGSSAPNTTYIHTIAGLSQPSFSYYFITLKFGFGKYSHKLY